MSAKPPRPGDPEYRHPYSAFESDPLWPLLEKGIAELVQNHDLVEKEDRPYIVGYLCKTIRNAQKKTKVRVPL
jgi:hypothetical protein